MCLTADPDFRDYANWFYPSWLPGVRCRHINDWPPSVLWRSVRRAVAGISRFTGVRKQLEAKTGALSAYLTGYDYGVWEEVSRWRQAIRESISSESPDVLFVRASGAEFYPHFAMLDWTCPVPWVAHYHDPFPLSLHPEPYRERQIGVSYWQERLHKRIVERADALTFPSRRLLEWVCSGNLSVYRNKGWVIPHLAMEMPSVGGIEANDELLSVMTGARFSILHSGSLLRHRLPWALLEGFREFLKEGWEQRELARLVFLGYVHESLLQSSGWPDGTEKNVLFRTQRVEYSRSQEWVRRATVAVVLEADSTESPFFQGKMADYLWLRKPILSLSPAKSVATDILGEAYQLRVSPGDAKGVTRALSTLWRYWKEDRLTDLVPGEDALSQVTEGAFLTTIERLLMQFSSAGRAA